MTSIDFRPRWSVGLEHLDHNSVGELARACCAWHLRDQGAVRDCPLRLQLKDRVPSQKGDAMPSAPSSILQHIGFVHLPKHEAAGGFDHAAVHAASGHVYVAHTANSALEVFVPASRRHLYSVPQPPGVAGVPVSDEAPVQPGREHHRHFCSRPRRASVEGSCRRSPQWPRLRS
jgi:hypothetical protein